LQEELEAFERDGENAEKFIALADRYTDFTELTPAMINEFIEKIIVYEADKSSGERDQEVEIFLNFVGKIDVPMPEPTQEEIVAEEKARQERARRRVNQRKYMEKLRQKKQNGGAEQNEKVENIS